MTIKSTEKKKEIRFEQIEVAWLKGADLSSSMAQSSNGNHKLVSMMNRYSESSIKAREKEDKEALGLFGSFLPFSH